MEVNSRVPIRLAVAEELEQLRELWTALYEHQVAHGMRLVLPSTAFDAWVQSIRPFLGRFAVVIIAQSEEGLIGFVAGRIRTLPPYFGSDQVGTISEVFVTERRRSEKLGKRMLEGAIAWFRENGIRRIELQVVARNPDAERFYERLGWQRELVQMVLE
jgi:GNAT superfamily N-acetyltransferase